MRKCNEATQRRQGCGFIEKYKGKATIKYTHGAPHLKTCPHYFAQSVFVSSVVELFSDYRKGALGNVLDLPCTLYDYLRIANNELDKWDRVQREILDRE